MKCKHCGYELSDTRIPFHIEGPNAAFVNCRPEEDE